MKARAKITLEFEILVDTMQEVEQGLAELTKESFGPNVILLNSKWERYLLPGELEITYTP